MKKLIALSLAMAVSLMLSVTAFAAPGNFVVSPSRNPAPEITDFYDPVEDCETKPDITSYADRDKLSDEDRKIIEDAYKDIINADDVTDLVEELKEVAEKLDIPVEDLAVSDLFDISKDCDEHDHSKPVTLTVSAETLDNYVGLIYYDGETWTLVENATLNQDGTLTFTVDEFGAYAFVVDTQYSPVTPPVTGITGSWFYLLMLVVSVAGMITVAFAYRSKEKA